MISPALSARPVRAAEWVNDVHSQLNRTRVGRVIVPSTEDELNRVLESAVAHQERVCASGARHSIGGQQFLSDSTLLDMRALDQVSSFDEERGLIEAGAGMQWPALIEACHALQPGRAHPWTIAQKQTGADNFTLGGSLSSNVHGRGLAMKPLVGDIESFTISLASGESLRCSRAQNPELFSLAIGGYGLFGVITRVQLRLARRRKLRRVVALVETAELAARFEQRRREGCLYGDFQFNIDEHSPDFLLKGVLACYEPVGNDKPVTAPRQLSPEKWLHLLRLAYTNRAEGFRQYAAYYQATHGQTYWSDLHQLSTYVPDYAAILREHTGGRGSSSLILTELCVPRSQLADFLRTASTILRSSGVPLIYGTIRLIERDDETFLAWAREDYACVVFNLLTSHTPSSLADSAAVFRELIDLSLSLEGSYYLTYHRFATRGQLLRAYSQFDDFCQLKRRYDPQGFFTSDWYRHYTSADCR